jgi:hypothetical protein
MGDPLGVDLEGEPLFLSGRVLDVNGQAIANALIEVWQPARNFRGQFRTDGDGNEPSRAKFSDVIMLLLNGGQERTEEQYRLVLRSGGFELTRVIPTASMLSIIEVVTR